MLKFIHVSLAQLINTMHNICKVRGSNLDHHKNKRLNLLSNHIINRWLLLIRKMLVMRIKLMLHSSNWMQFFNM